MNSWDHHQHFEAEWWGNCVNTFGEEAKQITYAYRMGLENLHIDGHWPVYDLQGKSILDIGGGPTSLLLKCINHARCIVVDPCPYPEWVTQRYWAADIGQLQMAGEDVFQTGFDEVWIYNVLQHVQDPEKIIRNARAAAPVVRIFEWLDVPAHEGHPHELKAVLLDSWLGGTGNVEYINENSAVGWAYYGSFG